MANHSVSVPNPSRQIAFHQLLVSARKTWLIDALAEALSRIEPDRLKEQLLAYAPPDAQQILASAGIRDEHVFPTPIVLEMSPTLVGTIACCLEFRRRDSTAVGLAWVSSNRWRLAVR